MKTTRMTKDSKEDEGGDNDDGIDDDELFCYAG